MVTKTGETELELSRWAERLRKEPPAPSRSRIVERALAVANRGAWIDWLRVVHPGRELPDGEGDPLFTDGSRAAQYWMQAALTAIIERKVTPLTPEQIAQWCGSAEGVLSLPSYSVVGGKLRTDVRYQEFEHHREQPDGMLALVLMWLLDEDDFGHRLSLCQHCGKFFLAKPPKKQGRWLRRYCSPTHMQEALAVLSRERSSKWRKNRKQK